MTGGGRAATNAKRKPASRRAAAKPKVLIGNLFELSKLPDMPSEPKIREIIREHPDFPVRKRGGRGVDYQIDLLKGRAFILGLRQAEEDAAKARAEEIQQLALELLGDDAASSVGDAKGMTAQERKALMEEELVAMKLQERRGELVRKADVERAIGDLVVLVRQRGDSFSARLAKKVDLPREAIAAIDRQMRVDQTAIAAAMEKMGNAAGLETDRDSALRDGGDADRAGGEPDAPEEAAAA